MKGLIITATDTDAGKTYLTSLVIQALRQQRVDAVGYKPLCCGGREDAYALQKAADGVPSIDEINPVYMRTAAAPYVADMFEKANFDPADLVKGAQQLGEEHQCVIVEGVGGWLVPIQRDYYFADLAKELDLPIVLVVNNRIGAINQALLSIEAMRSRGVEPAGLVFNNLSDELDSATISNKGVIEDLSGVEVLTDVIYQQEEIEAWPFMDLLGI
ncbi:dethiobiotin synthase [Persicirhabdus sediminis]|uniref:ATP-dependent dethiobiotin synthetase BioD n=1 Tax=Persicirhabdus sediminis TaxID=454144 RepID=A0A8J7MDB1_9BACT|nr:dethiobiotin synthase [Persicirhabdus sediminis]MBK1790531.1 dethiobiotin synthase [Persicirhabdus sediminis]